MSNLLIALVMFSAVGNPRSDPPPTMNTDPPGNVEDLCFAETLCAIKESVRWGTPKWEQAMCYRVANAIISAEKEYNIPRDLILAFMINESDMDEKAVRTYENDKGELYAQDGGLLGIRCVLGDDHKHCKNPQAKALRPTDLFKPEVNIRLGAAWLHTLKTSTDCPNKHKDHPWFAHYNWGSKVFHKGVPRSYPQRIAVLWRAIATTIRVDRPEIDKLRFVQVPGQKKITIDTPVGKRHRDLVKKIHACAKYTCEPAQLSYLAP